MTAPTSTRPTRSVDEPVTVDPRFRQRRVQVRKDAGRRRLHRLVALASVGGVFVAAVGVVYSPVLNVDRVDVEATSHLSADDVRAGAGIDVGSPILMVDLGAAERRLEALPWVDTAVVSRSLPGSIALAITERVPAAGVRIGDTVTLVDATGRVLGPAADAGASSGLIEVVLDDQAAELVPGTTVGPDVAGAIALAERVAENPANAVAAVVVAPDLHLELVEGGTVLLGDDSDLDQKIEDFRTVYARVDRTCLDTIDVRVPGRSVLTRDEPCS